MELTAREVVALFGVDERRVRKEVEHGIAGVSSPPRFRLADVLYFRALAELGFEMNAVADRKRLHAIICTAAARENWTVELGRITALNLHPIVREVSERLARFETWKRALVSDDAILGGETVFRRTRLAVRHVGAMLLRGERPDQVRADYPYLSDEDLEFAQLYARAYPAMGRPRERQAPAR